MTYGTPTSWTDDRIAELKKLCADGLSGSEIAGALGGVSRNAVIGKIMRMGLALKGGRPGSTEARLQARMNPKPRRDPTVPRSVSPRKGGVRSMKVAATPYFAAEPLPVPEAIDIPVEQRKTLLQLDAHTCRWPVGDPGEADFYFCGAEPHSDRPYCTQHCRMAYRPRGRAA